MKLVAAAVATWLSLSSVASAARDHPITKVIGLVEELEAKVEAEGKTEALSYEKFEYWCKNSKKTLSKAVAEEKERISTLEDEIDAKVKEEETLTKEIEELKDQIADMDAAALKAKNTRGDENKLYVTASGDLKSTIQAVKDAIKAMTDSKKAGPSLVQGELTLSDHQLQLLQKPEIRNVLSLAEAKADTQQQREMVAELLRQRPTQLAKGDRKAHVRKYAFKSGNVIELLKSLQLSFEDELTQVETEETNALNAYELAKTARDNAMQAADDSKTEKGKILSDCQQTLIDKRGELGNTQDDLKADSDSLEDTEKECTMKAQEWAERSAVRKQELEAMDAAKKILAKATEVRTEAPSNPVPPPNPIDAEGGAASFLQIADPKAKALNLLRAAARSTHSKALDRLAKEISLRLSGASKESPFGEVNNMIEKMIFRLMDEQKQEDEHKLWCDQEISKTNTSKVDKEAKVEELTDKIDTKKASSQELIEDVTEGNKMVADITAFMAEATDIRAAGKAENEAALKDAQEAQTALANAIAVLESFYKDSGMVEKESWEFVQEPVDLPKNPETWGASYTGVADPKKQPSGIIAVLKETASDFSAMEADTRAQEAMDEKAFQEEMSKSKIEKARRAKEVEMKTAENKRLEEKIASLQKSRKSVDKELELTVQYMKDLEPACVDGGSTYEDRKAARTAETEALRQAQQILKEAFQETGKTFLQVRRHVQH